jgi:hypothetical protein
VSHLAALLAFAGFLALGLRVRLAPPVLRRRRVQALLAYLLAVHGLAAALAWEAWPFTSHTIAVGRVRGGTALCTDEFVGVDGDGREWRLDPYAFMPVYDSVLQYWWDAQGARLPPGGQQQALAFLAARAEESRARQAQGRAIGPRRWLGPLGAPYWLLLRRPEAVSPAPYVGLKVYRACARRELVGSWPRP